jgi:hypothetical protein
MSLSMLAAALARAASPRAARVHLYRAQVRAERPWSIVRRGLLSFKRDSSEERSPYQVPVSLSRSQRVSVGLSVFQ